jgi:hypothetical protein
MDPTKNDGEERRSISSLPSSSLFSWPPLSPECHSITFSYLCTTHNACTPHAAGYVWQIIFPISSKKKKKKSTSFLHIIKHFFFYKQFKTHFYLYITSINSFFLSPLKTLYQTHLYVFFCFLFTFSRFLALMYILSLYFLLCLSHSRCPFFVYRDGQI